jgi:hypothetical protein
MTFMISSINFEQLAAFSQAFAWLNCAGNSEITASPSYLKT